MILETTRFNLSFLQTGPSKGLCLEKLSSQPPAASDLVRPKRPDDLQHCQNITKTFLNYSQRYQIERKLTFI